MSIVDTLNNRKFYLYVAAVTVLKVVLALLFSSGYENDLFIPFTDTFIDQFGIQNPYNFYYHKGIMNMFPYPPLMLFLVTLGRLLSRLLGADYLLANLLFKLPLFIFDFLGMYFLCRLFTGRRKYVAVLYFTSPIVIFASYMHGQLDLIPTIFLLGAVYFLTKRRLQYLLTAAILSSLALGTKFHIIAAVPIIFVFLLHRDGVKLAFQFLSLTALFTIAINLPFFGKGLLNCVYLNEEQGSVTNVFLNYGNVRVYLAILAVIIIYLRIFTLRHINKDLLYSTLGLLFSVFLLLVSPMPGWYVWIIPYLVILFVTKSSTSADKYSNIIIYAVLNGVYCLYFIFFHKMNLVGLYIGNTDLSFLKINSWLCVNVIFTIMTGFLLYSVYMLYRYGVRSNSYYRHNTTFTIGISGDSGSGKSRLLNTLEKLMGRNKIQYIEGDGDHKWARNDENWSNFTHLNPKANYIYRQAHDLALLRHGQHIRRVDYDHATGTFTPAHLVTAKPYTILCGLHALYLPQTRENLDLKIYMDIDEELRRFWKLKRDSSERGYDKKTVIEQIEARIPDARKYIYPQKEYADLIISYFDPTLKDFTDMQHHLEINLRLTLSSAIDMEYMMDKLSDYGISTKYDYVQDLKNQILIFSGDNLMGNNLPLDDIAVAMIPRIDEITRKPIEAEDNLHGIIELAILSLIDEKMSRK